MSQQIEEIRRLDEPVIVYAGPQLSRSAGLPSLRALFHELMREAEDYLSVRQHRELGDLAENSALEFVFGELESTLSPPVFARLVERAFDDARLDVPPLGRALAMLGERLRGVITPNLDRLLERAFGGTLAVFSEASADLGSRRGWMLKMQGSLERPQSWTWLARGDRRDRALYDDPDREDIFRALFLARPVLFVGTPLDDPILGELVARMADLCRGRPPQHCWALVDERQIGPAQRRRFSAAGVRLIGYEDSGEDLGECVDLLLSIAAPPKTAPSPSNEEPLPAALELPGDVVAPSSPYYIDRPGVEERCMRKVLASGALIRIKGPKQMGKTSLMTRLLAHARASGLSTVTVNLQMAERKSLEDLDRFLRWLCAVAGRQLGVRVRPTDDEWDDLFGAKDNCTAYFEDHFLSAGEGIVLAFDHIDRVFDSNTIADDFLALLRAWHEMGKTRARWDQLRMVLVHATEIYLPMNINHSPFNVGLPVALSEWDGEMVRELASRHGRLVEEADIDKLMAMLNGHPYLTRLAFHHLAEGMSEADLFESAATDQGIFAHHLKDLSWRLQAQPELRDAARRVMSSDQPLGVGTEVAFKLASLGLVHLKGDRVTPARELYRRYFSKRLCSGS